MQKDLPSKRQHGTSLHAGQWRQMIERLYKNEPNYGLTTLVTTLTLTLREKLIKIGAKVVRHSWKIVFQMAEVAVPKELFRAILEGIGRLRLAVASS